MRSYFLLLTLSLLLLPSCFVADNLLLEDEPKATLPFHIVVKDSVYNYIQNGKKADEKYLSYGFDPLKIIIPETIKEKEKWEGYRGNSGFDPAMVEMKIAEKDSTIRANNLTKKISISHTFSLRESGDTMVDLQNVDFILSNELELLDYLPNYQVELTTNQERLFAKFLYEKAILKAYSYEESQKISREFYRFFKDEWNRKDNSLEKNIFLRHILLVIEDVDKSNLFDVQSVSQSVLINHMRTKRAEIKGYTPVDFSALFEINENEKLTGYYFFHTFSYQNNEQTDRISVYVKFNPFYEVERIIETDQAYDAYEK